MILIGSRALSLRAPNLLKRQPLDFDFVATEQEVDSFKSTRGPWSEVFEPKPGKVVLKGESICEFDLVTPGSSNELLTDLVRTDSVDTSLGIVPCVDLLFTLKKSHRHLKNSPHFWKNFSDFHRLKSAGAVVRPEYAAFLKQREAETYTYKHPSLNQSKENFFGEDKNEYQYDHDSIHEAVAILDRPAYRSFQKDGAEVSCDREKFFACPRDIQLYSVVEESAVLACERSLVPYPGKLSPRQAWLFAFSKVCTSIASGWWRAFAYDSGLDVLKLYQPDFYEKFLTGVKTGIVREVR